MNALLQIKGTTAFFVQAIISFVVAFAALAIGIFYMPAESWVRGFLALGMLYITTSTFTLAKVIRDRQEVASVRRPESALPPNAPYVDAGAGSWS